MTRVAPEAGRSEPRGSPGQPAHRLARPAGGSGGRQQSPAAARPTPPARPGPGTAYPAGPGAAGALPLGALGSRLLRAARPRLGHVLP